MSDGTPLPNRSAETPVSGRDYPDEDPSGRRWSEIWRAAIEELNANALVSDLGTNRLNYEPEDGTLFVPTNGGDWYLGTGAGWKNLGAIGDIDNHIANTTNPHNVTAAQVDALATTGGTVTGGTTFTNTTHDLIDTADIQTDRLQEGENAVETISGTGATLSFTGTDTRDIHDVTDVSLSNSSGASVTEDVTLNYYQGTDNTGTLIESQTKSVTLADASSKIVQFLSGYFALDNVDYFLEVTTTALTTDSIEEITMGASYVTEQTSTGDLVTTDQNGRERARYDATSETASYPTVNAGEIQSARVLSQTGDEFIRFAPAYADSGSGTSVDPYINGVANAKADLAGPGIIVIPANVYCEEDNISITNAEHVSIWGAGRGQSFIIESGNSTNQTISVSADQSGSSHREFATLRGFSLLGRNNGTGIDGLQVSGDRHLFEDLHIDTYVDNGIKLSPSNIHNTFRNVYSHNNGKHGMRVNHCSVGHFENCSFRLNTSQGVWNAGGMANMLFDSCVFESNGRSGLFSNDTGTKWKFSNCFFEGNNTGAWGAPDVDIQNTALENIKIIFETCGFSATGDAPVALSLDYQENVDIRFCHFPASASGKDALTITNSKRIRTVGSEIPSPINDASNVLIDGNLATIGALNDPTTTDYDVTQLRNGTIITDDGTNAWVVVDETSANGALAI